MKDTRKKRLVHNFKIFGSLTWVIFLFLIFICLVIALAYLSEKINFEIKNIGSSQNVIVLLLFVASSGATLINVFKMRKNGLLSKNPFIAILSLYNASLVISSLVPLAVINIGISSNAVRTVVKNTYMFYGVLGITSSMTLIITIYLLRKNIEKNNWWLFILSVPYVVTGWGVVQDFTAFRNLVSKKDFDYSKVAEMLKRFEGMDVLLLNHNWYKIISISIVAFVLMIGVEIIEKTWKKTSKFR
ncbi:TPA: hypothetical protein ACWWDF_002411 [Enterococcus faecium]